MGQPDPDDLTRREREVLALLGEGRTNKQIAQSLSVDVRTAEFHVANVLGKLGLQSRAQAASYVAQGTIEASQVRAPNLPVSLTSFVGRDWEMATLAGLLQRSRLVTVTGAGGVGKTRLAIEAARIFERSGTGGVWFVDLAPLSNEDLVANVMLTALGLKELPGRSAEEALLSALRLAKRFLLIDNCEHVLDRLTPILQRLVATCPDIRILATSRVRLAVTGEVLLPLGGLRVSSVTASEETLGADSVRLFLDRAQQVRPGYEPTFEELADVAAVCRALDGMPLAIELAAARLSGMTLAEMRVRISRGFGLLTMSSRAVPARHRTLDAAIEWSYSLLSETAQAAFRRLSVCAGFDAETAKSLCTTALIGPDAVDEILLDLVDNSLVVAEPKGTLTRYRLLEPVRQYGLRQLLKSNEADETRRRHARHFGAIARRELPTSGPPRRGWVPIVETDQDNFRLALAWAARHDAGLELELVHLLDRFWSMRGQLTELIPAVEHAICVTKEASRERQRMLVMYADACWRIGDADRAINQASEAVELARALGLESEELRALNTLGNAQDAGRRSEALATYEVAVNLARGRADERRLGLLLHNFGLSLIHFGHLRRARDPLAEAHDIFFREGDREGIQTVLQSQACLAFGEGDDDLAATRWLDVVRIGHELSDRYQVIDALEGLARLCIKRGEAARGLRLAGAAAGIRAATGYLLKPDLPELPEWLARGRSSLSKAAGDQAWTEGVRMTYDQAIDCALESQGVQAAALPLAKNRET